MRGKPAKILSDDNLDDLLLFAQLPPGAIIGNNVWKRTCAVRRPQV